jgi:hypothetical protein
MNASCWPEEEVPMTGTLRAYTEADAARLAVEGYDHGEACFELDLRRAALLVIDMQPAG